MTMSWESAVEQEQSYMRRSGAPAPDAVGLICAAARVTPPENFDPCAIVASISDEDLERLVAAGPPFTLESAMRKSLIYGGWRWVRAQDGTIRTYSFRPLYSVSHITLRFEV